MPRTFTVSSLRDGTRSLVLAAVALASFGGGLFAHDLLAPRTAHADGYATSIQVPREGLTFRGEGGRAIARLSYDTHGGVFEVLDEHGSPSSTMGIRASTTAPPLPGPVTAWSLDDTSDPWGYRPRGASLPRSGL